MINKQQAQKLGINIIDVDNKLSDDKVAIIDKIKALLPNIINSDNQLDSKALNDLLGVANNTSNNQGYELTFAGKGLARAKADAPTNKELKVEIEQSKNFETTDNVVIRGDNIEALKILYKNYHKQIKMIYIDPPYNTKSENFVYNDNFKVSEAELINEFGLNEDTTNFLTSVYGTRSHSGWLSFMYPRLKLARELLTDDGVIFISIDDNEQANLKVMCDEIFGEDNFVAEFIWAGKSGSEDDSHIRNNKEYILCYAKRNDLFNSGLDEKQDEKFIYYDELKKDNYKRQLLRKWGDNSKKEDRPNLYYPIKDANGNDFFPTLPNGEDGCWRWSKETMQKAFDSGIIEFATNGKYEAYEKIYESDISRRTKKFQSLLTDLGSSAQGTSEIKNIFNTLKVFSNPKPTILLRQLSVIANIEDNDVVLDFFAGSGTTGNAVMQLNAQDGGNRKFILVQWDEKIAEEKEAYKFCVENSLEPVISSITIERLNRAGEKIKKEQAENKTKTDLLNGDNITNELDIGYKVFSLVDKPFCDYQNDSLSIINARVGALNILYNMLVATCKKLDTKIEEIIPDVLYKADNEIYVIGGIDVDTLSKYKDLKVNIDAFVDISLENYLNLGLLDKDNVYMIYC